MTKMRHQLDFADSLRRESSIVLGLLLRPFSIGMELELLRARSPFVMCQKFSEIEELPPVKKTEFLIFACDACSQSESERAESNRLLRGNFKWHDFRSRAQKLQLEKIWEEWDGAILKLDLGSELEKFWQYICAGKTGPEFVKPESDKPATPIGAPEMCILLHYIRSLKSARLREWGSSELDFPVAVARYEYYTLLESQGKVSLKSDSVETLSDFAAKMDAKVASGAFKMPETKSLKKSEEEQCPV